MRGQLHFVSMYLTVNIGIGFSKLILCAYLPTHLNRENLLASRGETVVYIAY